MLHVALLNDAKAVASYLLKSGLDVNARTSEGSTPLHYAVGRSDKQTVKALLSKGADGGVKDRRGRTALHTAAYVGNSTAAEVLLAHGVDVDPVDNQGVTPLLLALDGMKPLDEEEREYYDEKVEGIVEQLGHKAKKQWQIALMLLQRGANPDTRDTAGVTPRELGKRLGIDIIAALEAQKSAGP